MSDEREPLPHRLLFNCECLLQELKEKYPDSLLNVFRRLTEIKKEYELYERIENETSEQKEERKKLALSWLDKWGEGQVIEEIKVVKGKYRPKVILSNRDYDDE